MWDLRCRCRVLAIVVRPISLSGEVMGSSEGTELAAAVRDEDFEVVSRMLSGEGDLSRQNVRLTSCEQVLPAAGVSSLGTSPVVLPCMKRFPLQRLSRVLSYARYADVKGAQSTGANMKIARAFIDALENDPTEMSAALTVADGHGRTPLHCLALSNNGSVLRMLGLCKDDDVVQSAGVNSAVLNVQVCLQSKLSPVGKVRVCLAGHGWRYCFTLSVEVSTLGAVSHPTSRRSCG